MVDQVNATKSAARRRARRAGEDHGRGKREDGKKAKLETSVRKLPK